MANLVNKVANLLGVAREVFKDKVSDSAPNLENEQVQAIKNLSAQVEQTNLDVARKSANCALEEVMEVWRIEGSAGNVCPRSLMATPCSVVEHPPADGN